MNITKDILNREEYIWIKWFFVVAIIGTIHLLTLSISPTIWQDEVQIIDYGRVFLDPHTDWSVSWLTKSSSPSYSLSYLGCFLQEIAYQFTHSPVGPRLTSLAGAILAATICLAWLLSRNTPKSVAFLASLVFLLDPVLVSSYRGARVDAWAMALCFCSCWLLRKSHKVSKSNYHKLKLSATLSGTLIGVSLFIWPSSVILIPLVILEILDLAKFRKKISENRFNGIGLIICFFLGVVFTCILLSIPILDNINFILSNLFKITKADSALTNKGNTFNIDLLRVALLLSPFILPLTLISLFFVRNNLLRLVVVCVFIFAFATRPYSQRLIYLLPYFMIVVSELSKTNILYNLNQSLRRCIRPILLILLIWSAIISLGYRSIVALSQTQGRSPQFLEQTAFDAIGPGPYKVVAPYSFYYAGRSLGWKIRYPAPYLSSLKDEKLLSETEFFIVPENAEHELHSDLTSAGLKYQKVIGEDIENEQKKLFFGGKPFGEYILYSRDTDLTDN